MYVCMYYILYIRYMLKQIDRCRYKINDSSLQVYKLQNYSTHSLAIHISLYKTSLLCAIFFIFKYNVKKTI